MKRLLILSLLTFYIYIINAELMQQTEVGVPRFDGFGKFRYDQGKFGSLRC